MTSAAGARWTRSMLMASGACLVGIGVGSPAAAQTSRPMDLKKGVVVVATSEGVKPQAWELATKVYADQWLRPARLSEPTARVLAGEKPLADASSQQLQELDQVLRSLKVEDPLAPRALASVAQDLDVSAVLVVYAPPSMQARAKLYVQSSRSFYDRDLWPQPDTSGQSSWQAVASWLHGHVAAARSASVQRTKAPESANNGMPWLRSGWFWGAVGAAVGAAVVVYAVKPRDDSSSDTIHLQGRVAP